MKRLYTWLLPCSLIMLILAISGCSSVPKEVVELSYQMGEDISAVHQSYNKLIHEHFEMLRQERIKYLNDLWTPKYISTWMEDGRLIDVAKGEVAWSQEQSDFVKPTAGKEKEELLMTVKFWSQAAVNEIENKKVELLEPLNVQEEQLTSLVTDAFNRLYRGNATITAHLNSLRNVQEVQNNLLEALNLRDFRDKINIQLSTVSEKAQKALEEIKKADGFVTDGAKKLNNK